MNEDKISKLLQEKYPGLDPLCGIWVPPGWVNLVDELLESLNKIPGWKNSAVSQIKEKFGGLRFYIDVRDAGGNVYSFSQSEAYALIVKAERDSTTICDQCGKPGKLSGKGWLATLCEAHAPK